MQVRAQAAVAPLGAQHAAAAQDGDQLVEHAVQGHRMQVAGEDEAVVVRVVTELLDEVGDLLGDAGTGERRKLVTFNVGDDAYSVSNATSGNGIVAKAYATKTSFHLTFRQTSEAGGSWTVQRVGGNSVNGTFAGTATGFKLYCGNTDGGNEDALFFNRLKVQ